MKKRKDKKSAEVEVNMTPMLDIVFIMLIFFIVSSTFIRESGLDLTEHKEDKNKTEDISAAKSIVIKVCADKNIYIDRRSIDARSVRANVERKLAESGSAVVIIKSEEEAPTGEFVMVLNQARAAKAKISVSPEKAVCST